MTNTSSEKDRKTNIKKCLNVFLKRGNRINDFLFPFFVREKMARNLKISAPTSLIIPSVIALVGEGTESIH